ncbi:MAG: sterol desaturase family protein [Legionella sp.]|nr:sterol desaturase family protein [Legionella sp.]
MKSYALLSDLFISWLAVYGSMVAIYFITGWVIGKIVANRPDLKIQKGKEVLRENEIVDIKQSMISLISVSFLIGLGYTLQKHGYTLFPIPDYSLLQMIILYPLFWIMSLIIYDTWFYWIHRLMHIQPIFKYVHAWHHRKSLRTISVWANNSDTVWDNLILQSYWCFAFILFPFPPIVLFTHKIYDHITGLIGHSGYEISGSLPLKFKMIVAVVHHDQHHSAVKYNFATHFTWWDRMIGTLHPDYDDQNQSFKR